MCHRCHEKVQYLLSTALVAGWRIIRDADHDTYDTRIPAKRMGLAIHVGRCRRWSLGDSPWIIHDSSSEAAQKHIEQAI